MKAIIKISILITGIIVAIICVKTTVSLKSIDGQKEHLSHYMESPDAFVAKSLPHYAFINRNRAQQ